MKKERNRKVSERNKKSKRKKKEMYWNVVQMWEIVCKCGQMWDNSTKFHWNVCKCYQIRWNVSKSGEIVSKSMLCSPLGGDFDQFEHQHRWLRKGLQKFL